MKMTAEKSCEIFTGDKGEKFERYYLDIVVLRDQHKRKGVFD